MLLWTIQLEEIWNIICEEGVYYGSDRVVDVSTGRQEETVIFPTERFAE